jgi:hypothetical protein
MVKSQNVIHSLRGCSKTPFHWATGLDRVGNPPPPPTNTITQSYCKPCPHALLAMSQR